MTNNHWSIQRNLDTSIPVWSPKVCAQINEKQLRKFSCIQISKDKILIAIVSKHCKTFYFTKSLLLLMLFFFSSTNNRNCFHVMF